MAQYLMLLVVIAWNEASVHSFARERCEKITIDMCKNVGYNLTSMPNHFEHDTQDEAAIEVTQFSALVSYNCSSDLTFFLCSLYTPICLEEYEEPIPPCRPVCQRAQTGCEPVMKKFGFDWPNNMRCDQFPVNEQESLCMDPRKGSTSNSSEDNFLYTTVTPFIKEKDQSKSKPSKPKSNQKNKERKPVTLNPVKSEVGIKIYSGSQCYCQCQNPMITITDSNDRMYYNVVSTGGIINCVQPCQSAFFSKHEQKISNHLLTIFAILCFISSIFVMFTFLGNTERFRYPEKSIIFLSGCYIMISLGFLARLFWSREEIACDHNKIRYPLAANAKSGPCVIVFFLIYFFGASASIWWVILTFTWFLSASLKWSTEAISSYSLYFHLSAWLVPAIKCFVIVTLDAIDGEPLAGICGVGHLNLSNLVKFVILPNSFYLVTGIFFLFFGFISLYRIRNLIRQQAKVKSEKLENLMVRIIIFSSLYIFPMLVVTGCNIYDYYYREIWERHFNCPCLKHYDIPYLFLYMIKYIMYLAVGVATFFWILSGKTFQFWFNCFKACCCFGQNSRNSTNNLITSQHIMNNQRPYKQIPLQKACFTSSSHIPHRSSSGFSYCKVPIYL